MNEKIEDYSTILMKKIRELLIERGWSLEDLVRATGMSENTIDNIYYGKTKNPRISTLIPIADAFCVSVDSMVREECFTFEETNLLAHYRMCGKHGKSTLRSIAEYEAIAVKAEREADNTHWIRCIMPRGEIRKGILYDLCDYKEIETDKTNAFIAIQMTDNDLAPRFFKGDIILFEDRFPENGEIAGFFKSDKAYLRKFVEEKGKYVLQSLYPKESDIIIQRMDDIKYLGTCCGVLRS